MSDSKKSYSRLIKNSLALLLMTNTYSAFAGAEVEVGSDNRSVCFESGTTEICLSTASTWHQVETPSGNVIYKFKGEDNIKFTDIATGLITSTEDRFFKERYLEKAGEVHNSFTRSLNIDFFNDGVCYSLIVEDIYKVVNGKVILDQENTEEIACD